MTDGLQATPSEVEIKQAIEGQSVDWYLQTLVQLCNRTGLEIGITLNIGGSVISGLLIGGKRYFEDFAKEFSDAWDGPDKEDIRAAFAQHGAIYDKPSATDQDEQVSPSVQYIHLANARVFTTNQPLPSNRGVLWRGKINAVSGFWLGQLASQ